MFLIEILSNLYVYGLNYYLRDRIMFLDTAAIFFSMMILIWKFTNNIWSLSFMEEAVIGVFRMTRLFLIYRKIE